MGETIVEQVIIYGRPIPLGITLIDARRGWIRIEGEQFAVRLVGKTWRVINCNDEIMQSFTKEVSNDSSN